MSAAYKGLYCCLEEKKHTPLAVVPLCLVFIASSR
jgi:hypothetical protein